MRALIKTASRSNLNLIAGLSLIIGLAACGGGGSSSSGGGGGSTLPTAPVTITTANAPQVAGAAVDAAIGGMDMSMGVQTSAPAPSAVATVQKMGKIGHGAVQRIISQGAAPATVMGVVQSIPCTVSGSMSFDPAVTTSITTTFTNCSDVAGETINGTISVTGITATATATAADMTFNITFTDASGTGTVTGNMHIAENLTTMAITISGTSLTMTHTVEGSMGLQDYLITTDASGNITAMTFTFASTVIGGTATFLMVTPFVFTGTAQFPSSGSAIISGAGLTKLRLTALGNETAAATSQAKLELSIDNGATYASPTYPTWASISNNL